jgi:hypothetical protein
LVLVGQVDRDSPILQKELQVITEVLLVATFRILQLVVVVVVPIQEVVSLVQD